MQEEKHTEDLKKERDEYLAGWQRAKADLLNYKKEEKERIQLWMNHARQELVLSLLPVLDNLERAEKEMKEEEGNHSLIQGFLRIGKQIREFFKSQGIKEMPTAGEQFNPDLHEAVGETEGAESGKVAEVVEKGYLYDNKLIRPAKVIVIK